MAKNGIPKLYDPGMYINAGIDPKTGIPIKLAVLLDGKVKESFAKNIAIMDEQEAINRYEWYNLPSEIDSNILERVLYYKGQGMLFYLESTQRFYFLPFCLNAGDKGTGIDVYERYLGVSPLLFNGSTGKNGKEILFSSKIFTPIYDLLEAGSPELIKSGAVLLTDYSKQISQNVIPRATLQAPIIEAMAEAPAFARTNLIANSGVKAWRVNDEDQQSNVIAASMSMYEAAISGRPFMPVVGSIEFQDMTAGGSVLKSEEFLLYMQSLDNMRMSMLGLKNGGIFRKKAHMLQEEQDTNEQSSEYAYEDGLKMRQQFCTLVNANWGLNIWCDRKEMNEDNQQEGEENNTTNSTTNANGEVYEYDAE